MENLLVYIVSSATNIIFMSVIYMVFIYLTTKLFKFGKRGWKTAFLSGLLLAIIGFLSSVVWIQIFPPSSLTSILSSVVWVALATYAIKYFYEETTKKSFYVALIIWGLQMIATFVLIVMLSAFIPELGAIP